MKIKYALLASLLAAFGAAAQTPTQFNAIRVNGQSDLRGSIVNATGDVTVGDNLVATGSLGWGAGVVISSSTLVPQLNLENVFSVPQFISLGTPQLWLNENDVSPNNRAWAFGASGGGACLFAASDDAMTVSNGLCFARSGANITGSTLSATTQITLTSPIVVGPLYFSSVADNAAGLNVTSTNGRITAYPFLSSRGWIQWTDETGAALNPATLQASDFAFSANATGTLADFVFNGVGLNAMPLLAASNNFVGATNTFNDIVVDSCTGCGGGSSFPLRAPDGSGAAPSYSFTNATDGGMYLRFGTNIALVGPGGNAFIDVGSSSSDSIAVNAGTDINIVAGSNDSNGALVLTAGSTGEILASGPVTRIASAGVTKVIVGDTVALYNDADAEAIPPLEIQPDMTFGPIIASGGIISTGAHAIGGGVTVSGLRVAHAAPNTFQDGDIWTTTSGLFARINGATVGPYVATVTQTGSFTGTLTGCTGTPTGTFTWTLSGGIVVLNTPGFSSTACASNSTSMTVTGASAAIRPSSTATGAISVAGAYDNSTNVNSGVSAVMNSSGTLTYRLNGVAAGWNSMGNKAPNIPNQGNTITYALVN